MHVMPVVMEHCVIWSVHRAAYTEYVTLIQGFVEIVYPLILVTNAVYKTAIVKHVLQTQSVRLVKLDILVLTVKQHVQQYAPTLKQTYSVTGQAVCVCHVMTVSMATTVTKPAVKDAPAMCVISIMVNVSVNVHLGTKVPPVKRVSPAWICQQINRYN